MTHKLYNNTIPKGEYIMVEHIKGKKTQTSCCGLPYTLPIATHMTLGGIIVGDGLQIDSRTGKLSVIKKDSGLKDVYDGKLTITGTGMVTGGGNFTANQLSNTLITLNVPNTISSFINDSGFITTESDPTVPLWVKSITEADIASWGISGVSSDLDNSLILGSDNKPYYKELSASTIKTLYESNTNTNAFTDLEKTKLLGLSIPEDGLLTVSFTGAVTDSFTFSANQSTPTSKTINIPAVDLSSYTPSTRTITAGDGLTGGGDLTANRIITLGTPQDTTLVSSNNVTVSSHSHAFTPGGTIAQYIRGDGTLALFPSIPAYDLTPFALKTTTITINGTTQDLSTNRSWTIPISTGTVTSVALTGSGALSFTGSPITTAGTFATSWTGSTSQYIRGNGSLATFPTIPTVNNGTLTLATSGIATGSQTFSANQNTNTTFTVNVPPTNLGSSLSGGTTLNITSSTGTPTAIDLAPILPSLSGYTPTSRQIIAGDGLTGGGNLTADRTITLGTPSSITLASANTTTGTTHTHAFTPGGTSAQYIRGDGALADLSTATYSPSIFNPSGAGPISNFWLIQHTGSTTGRRFYHDDESFKIEWVKAGGQSQISLYAKDGVKIGGGSSTYTLGKSSSLKTTNLSANQDLEFPNASGILPLTVNGISANSVGEITIPIGTGTVTSVGLNGSGALSFTGSPITSSGSIYTDWLGSSSQYVRGDGSLQTFPTIPTVNNATLTLATSGIATGSQTFTANDATSKTFTVAVPGTNLGSSLTGGTTLNITSSTGTNTSIDLAPILPAPQNLQSVTTAGNTTDKNILINRTVSAEIPLEVVRIWADVTNPLQRWSRGNLTDGYLDVTSGAPTAFIPTIDGTSTIANGHAIWFRGRGKLDYGAAATFGFRAYGNGNNAVTAGNIFQIQNLSTNYFLLAFDGKLTLGGYTNAGTLYAGTGGLVAGIPTANYSIAVVSIPANSQTTIGTATVTGAVVGDVCEIVQPISALMYKVRVTATNTVTIYAINPTTSPINTVSESLKIKIIK